VNSKGFDQVFPVMTQLEENTTSLAGEAPALPPCLLCFGYGYTARFLARTCLEAGWRVIGTRRPGETEEADGEGGGVEIHPFDRQTPLAGEIIAAATHILSSVPPDNDGDPVLDVHGQNLAAAQGLRWLGYLSTTGVYGDRKGGWVDEDSKLSPAGLRGERRCAAEAAWLALRRDFARSVHIFRLAGIYGPGRSALDSVRAGKAKRIVKPGQVFSRIHVADIVQVLRASMEQPSPGAVYNVCDDAPAPPQDVIAHACALLGVDPPPETPFEAAEMSDMGRSFWDENKRVRNTRIKADLGVDLAYPDYRTGLAALLAAEGSDGG